MPTNTRLFAALLAWGAVAACQQEEPAPPPEPICLSASDAPAALVFTDVTAALGLGPDGLAATATGVTVADVNGDGWPDLALTEGKAVREDPAAPAGAYRLLVNEQGQGFRDETFTSGLFTGGDGPGRASTFVVFGDFDNDGDADAFSAVYVDYATDDPGDASAVFLNDGSGRFTRGQEDGFTVDYLDPLAGAALLDADRDGRLDLFVGHHYGTYGMLSTSGEDLLFAGDGAGGFADVTAAAGLALEPFALGNAASNRGRKPTWGVAACDLDGDGWSEILTTSYGRQQNMLWQNLGGTFADLSEASGFAHDGNEDFADNEFYRCFCEAHPDEPTCADAEPAGIDCTDLGNAWSVGSDDQPWRLGGNSSGTLCGDLDEDGDLDLVAIELAHWHIGGSSDKTELLRNDGFPGTPFVRPGNETTGLTREHILSWNEGDLGGLVADFDNDGRLDVLVLSSDYPGTYALLWQNQGGGAFAEVGETAGVRVDRAHGGAAVDYDRDGDLDLVIGSSLMRWSAADNPPAPERQWVRVLRNDTGHAANKLALRFAPPAGSNRDAIGARVTVRAGGRTLLREVQGPYGLQGFQHDPVLYVGLGSACAVDEVEVRWPDAAGTVTTFGGVRPNELVTLAADGSAVYAPLPLAVDAP